MTLKEKILNTRPTITKEDLERAADSPKAKQYSKFLDICERLEMSVNLSNIHCSTYKEVFELIEKHHVDISDIISDENYDDYKNMILNMKSKRCPSLGKLSDKIYDLNNPEDYEAYLNKQNEKRQSEFEK